ncbi:MAG: AAA family ATPase [Candidatus Nanoarchaeia archaeon]
MTHAKIIGFISIKGGVGKTSTVANIGTILSANHHKKVLLVDANFSGPNLGLLFGFTQPSFTLHDVLEGRVPINKAIYEHSSGVHLLPAALLSRKIDTAQFKKYLHSLRNQYDMILIDSSPCLNEEILATINASDELFILTTPDYVTLASTMHALKTSKEKKVRVSGIILNKIRGKNYELGLEMIEDLTKTPVVALLDYDSKILKALSKTTPAALLSPNSSAIVSYKKLASALIGERFHDKRFISNFKRIFSKGLSKEDINRAIVMESHY